MTRALALALALALASTAQARHSAADLHDLAHALVIEADGHRADYAPIAFVLERRWRLYRSHGHRVGLGVMVRKYSAGWHRTAGPRALAIRALPWAPVAAKWGGRRWDRVRRWVTEWAAGEHADPCPGAMHWGGDMDRPPHGYAVTACGDTRNTFYAVKRRTMGGT